jgi:hypothetical protein
MKTLTFSSPAQARSLVRRAAEGRSGDLTNLALATSGDAVKAICEHLIQRKRWDGQWQG